MKLIGTHDFVELLREIQKTAVECSKCKGSGLVSTIWPPFFKEGPCVKCKGTGLILCAEGFLFRIGHLLTRWDEQASQIVAGSDAGGS